MKHCDTIISQKTKRKITVGEIQVSMIKYIMADSINSIQGIIFLSSK